MAKLRQLVNHTAQSGNPKEALIWQDVPGNRGGFFDSSIFGMMNAATKQVVTFKQRLAEAQQKGRR